MMHVDVPTTFTTSPACTPAPIASQWASNAPTGIGMPSRKTEPGRPLGGEVPATLVAGGVTPGQPLPHALEQRIHFHQKLFRRQTAQRSVPHPLMAHGADGARRLERVADTAERGRRHIAVFQRGAETRRASPGCAAASAAAWKSPTRRNKRRRTIRWPPAPRVARSR